jgi:hypothetical protein
MKSRRRGNSNVRQGYRLPVRRLILQILLAVLIFASGIAVGAAWHARRSRGKTLATPAIPAPVAQTSAEKPWPLNKQIVSRSLQTQSFRTDNLRTNSDHDVVWRWLQESITKYPQNWVKLDISYQHTYGVVLYPPTVLEAGELTHCNRELAGKGLPLLIAGKRYLPVQVNIDDIDCPAWHGFIDADEARLVYFEGVSA